MKYIMPCLMFLLIMSTDNAVADEAPISLDQLRWQYRVLLLSSPSNEMENLHKAINYYSDERKERKMLVVIASGKGLSCFPSICDKLKLDSSIRAALIDDKKGLLIGLDGGIKETYSMDEFDFNQVFAAIDRMPMRRAQRNY